MESFIKKAALANGFSAIGITSAEPVGEVQHLQDAIDQGRVGGMSWLARDPDARCDPRSLLPGARSVICCAMAYGQNGIQSRQRGSSGQQSQSSQQGESRETRESGEASQQSQQVSIARFARGEDYHVVVHEKLTQLWDALKACAPQGRAKICVDTSPVMEKALAARAGLGWIGKHTILLNSDLGSWFLLGEIITDLELEPDDPTKDLCGDCRACIDACPTKALVAPHTLDARRCISYLTIEQVRESRVTCHASRYSYGCDICQEACPYNIAQSGRML